MYNVKTVTDLNYKNGQAGRNLVDFYLPEGKEEFPLIIFIHGGGMEGGERNSKGMKCIGEELAKFGIAAALPEYSLYPDAKFPDFIEDIAQCAAFVKDEIKKYGKCTDLFLGGHSAGAYLSMIVALDPKYLAKHNMTYKDFSGFIYASGQPTTHFNILRERGIDTKKVVIDDAGPLFHVGTTGTSPTLVIAAENDLENRVNQINLFVATLKIFNPDTHIEYHILDGADHGSYIFKRPNGQSPICNYISDFILSNLKK